MYVTETTRHADVILPPLAHLERPDIDIVFTLVSVRNRALQLAGPLMTAERIVDAALRAGPYGILHRGRRGLDMGKVQRSVHGIDLGPLQPRLPDALRTPGKQLHLAPEVMLAEAAKLDELAARREAAPASGYDLTLIGRRQLRSNNSWMHNSARLMKGADRCTALLHPDDAAARGLLDGQRVRVSSGVGSIELPLLVSDEMRPGVVSVPHGFGHMRAGVGWRVAAANADASMNDITDPAIVDGLTGNAAFNAVPVRVDAVAAPASPPEIAVEAGLQVATEA